MKRYWNDGDDHVDVEYTCDFCGDTGWEPLSDDWEVDPFDHYCSKTCAERAQAGRAD